MAHYCEMTPAKTLIVTFLLLFGGGAKAQFAPPVGQEGTSAMHRDSSAFVAWAATCEVERGPMDIADLELGLASAGLPEMAVGLTMGTVSLGDGGMAVLTFTRPITNGPGPDFAVFENSFSDTFLELAFVEVSSDGEQFFRFPSVSLTDTDTQVGSFGSVDATKVHNLAGKYRAQYGTPFDLDDLTDTAGLDTDRITHVRIIDVVGSIDPQYATYDSGGNIVNDPWPTPFESSGFDLDAVGVIHEAEDDPSSVASATLGGISVYPNPTADVLHVRHSGTVRDVRITDLRGATVLNRQADGNTLLDLSSLSEGMYVLQLSDGNRVFSEKIIVRR